MTEHTALPWEAREVFARGGSMGHFIVDNDGRNITYHEQGGNYFALIPSKANARFIVTACNNYEQVLDALKRLRHAEKYSSRLNRWDIGLNEAQIAADEAIRQAEESVK